MISADIPAELQNLLLAEQISIISSSTVSLSFNSGVNDIK
jgi:hypothetical protein